MLGKHEGFSFSGLWTKVHTILGSADCMGTFAVSTPFPDCL